MIPTAHLRLVSDLTADPETVWAAASDPRGINRELRPWLRMTCPAGVERLTPETVPLGQRLRRSRILLFGVLPIDYKDRRLLVPSARMRRNASTSLRAPSQPAPGLGLKRPNW